eukprot:scaffold3664_cov407-Prasinococcus_capsulatus_cf.AAC.2
MGKVGVGNSVCSIPKSFAHTRNQRSTISSSTELYSSISSSVRNHASCGRAAAALPRKRCRQPLRCAARRQPATHPEPLEGSLVQLRELLAGRILGVPRVHVGACPWRTSTPGHPEYRLGGANSTSAAAADEEEDDEEPQPDAQVQRQRLEELNCAYNLHAHKRRLGVRATLPLGGRLTHALAGRLAFLFVLIAQLGSPAQLSPICRMQRAPQARADARGVCEREREHLPLLAYTHW